MLLEDGGVQGIMNNFCVYNIETNQWTVLPPMKIKRSQHCLVFHMDFIYAIGGQNYDGVILCVERYSLAQNEWEICGNTIKSHAVDACAVSYKEGIVMCDLHHRFGATMSIYVQVYNPQKDAWHIAYIEELVYVNEFVDPIPLLTIQDTALYLVSFGGIEKKYCLPNVKKLDINFACDGGTASPCKCLDIVDLGDVCVVPESRVKAFGIHDKAFVSKYHATYQVVPQINSEVRKTEYQLDSKWQKLSEYYNAALLFSFDKRHLSSKVGTKICHEWDTYSSSD